jgi:hypothetical protein
MEQMYVGLILFKIENSWQWFNYRPMEFIGRLKKNMGYNSFNSKSRIFCFSTPELMGSDRESSLLRMGINLIST